MSELILARKVKILPIDARLLEFTLTLRVLLHSVADDGRKPKHSNEQTMNQLVTVRKFTHRRHNVGKSWQE